MFNVILQGLSLASKLVKMPTPDAGNVVANAGKNTALLGNGIALLLFALFFGVDGNIYELWEKNAILTGILLFVYLMINIAATVVYFIGKSQVKGNPDELQ